MFDFDIPQNIINKFWDTENNKCEELICVVPIGYSKRVYRIYLKTELDDTTEVGFTNYQEAKNYIKCLDMHMITKTLIHELTHAWLYENGHNQVERQFNYEDVCEICACSYEFIYDTLKQFYENLFKINIKSTDSGKHSR